jgi:hypothetical protein
MGTRWIEEFAQEYRKHINIPFFGCTNPVLLKNENLIRQLKRAGMVFVLIGVQAIDEQYRMEKVKRPDSDKDIAECAALLRKHDIYFQINHIFGLDSRDYSDHNFLRKTVDYYLRLKPNRTHCFELEYLPCAEISEQEVKAQRLSRQEYDKILNGERSVAYNFGGSIRETKTFIPYIVLLDLRPFLPEKAVRFLMDNKLAFAIIRKIPLGYLVLARLLNTILHPRDVEGRPHYRKYIDGVRHIVRIKRGLKNGQPLTSS